MKKIYMKPSTTEVFLNMQHQLLAGSDRSFGALNEVDNANDETKNGGWNSRGGFWDDEEY